MNFSALQWTSIAFSIGSGLVYATLFLILVKRKLHSEFPLFLTYAALASLTDFSLTAIVLMAGPSSKLYFYSWWGLNTPAMLLEFGIMYEILLHLLKPYAGLIDLGKILFRWAAVFLLLVAGLSALATAGSGMNRCVAAITLIERNLRLMQCGLLLLFFVFERRLALSWRSQPISLALGLGLSSAIGLSLTYIRLNLRTWAPFLDLTDTISAFGIVSYWAFCFGRTQAAAQTVLDSPSKLIFQRWNEALQSTPMTEDKNPALATVDSFLPGIEKTVERVLARKIAH